MNLKEAIKIHNELCNKEEIKKYCEALHIVCEKILNCKPKKEYYKSSIINDYYIEYPYMELTISNGKAVYRRHKYSCSRESKDKKIKNVIEGYRKKIYGEQDKNGNYIKKRLPDKHNEWKGRNKTFGNKIFNSLKNR